MQVNANSTHAPADSKAGYLGAFTIAVLTLIFTLYIPNFEQHQPLLLTAILTTTFTIMLTYELLFRAQQQQGTIFGDTICALSPSTSYLLRSTAIRYLILIAPWLVMNFLMQQHYYFQSSAFAFACILFDWITWSIIALGIPYVYLTLRYRGQRKYEYNDYAILMLLMLKACYLACKRRPHRHISHNRRSHKMILVWLVTLFFLPLMLMFYNIEFSALLRNINSIQSPWFDQASFYQRYDVIYQCLFHLIFVLDSGLGIIAYAVSSRWLDNRVRSVDRTMSGWFVALLCYPPMNSAFTSQFIGYNYFSSSPIISSEIVQMTVWTIILLLFSLYVWSTAALGFKFSNLCNRGIITSGPYQYFRHPAYTCKNIAWWFENSHVLSSIPASLALLAGNVIYILRGLTEERHLKQDNAYLAYCKKVQGKFFFK